MVFVLASYNLIYSDILLVHDVLLRQAALFFGGDW